MCKRTADIDRLDINTWCAHTSTARARHLLLAPLHPRHLRARHHREVARVGVGRRGAGRVGCVPEQAGEPDIQYAAMIHIETNHLHPSYGPSGERSNQRTDGRFNHRTDERSNHRIDERSNHGRAPCGAARQVGHIVKRSAILQLPAAHNNSGVITATTAGSSMQQQRGHHHNNSGSACGRRIR